MNASNRRIGRAACGVLLMFVLLTWGPFSAAPGARASALQRAPANLGTVLLRVQPTQGPFSGFNPNSPAFTAVRAGHNPRLVLFAYFSGVTSPISVHVSLTGRRAGKLVFESAGAFNVGRAELGGASSGWRWYWNDIGALTRHAGRLDFAGTISAGGVQQRRMATLTVF